MNAAESIFPYRWFLVALLLIGGWLLYLLAPIVKRELQQYNERVAARRN